MNSYRSIQNETTDVKEGSQNISAEEVKRDIENLPELVGSGSNDIESNLTENVDENTEDLVENGITKEMEGNTEGDLTKDINANGENIDDLIGMENTEDMMIDNGFVFDDLGQGSTVDASVKDPLLSNLGLTIGVTAGVFAFSVVIGILLAKKRIKKGIDLYEN